MEASALHVPAPVGRLSVALPVLRPQSDEQLVALFRAGADEAFRVLHDRYRQRLFAYVRQMLTGASRQDAEDVLQDVFVRAYGALRADERPIAVRAWLYRVAHNRCVDQLRRPAPVPADLFEASRKPLHDPIEEAQRREDLRRLVADMGRLPAQQRSALLMRELDGLSYHDLATALDVTVPAVKSLLVRARIGLVEAAEARDADCCEIRRDLLAAYDRGVKCSGRARRHMRECPGCRDYRAALRGVRRSFAALLPGAGLGPLAVAAKAIGIGGASGSAAVTAAGGAATGGALAGATACKVAAVVCTAALTAGGAVEVTRLANHPARERASRTAERERVARPAAAPSRASAPQRAWAPPLAPAPRHGAAHADARAASAPAGAAARRRARERQDHRAAAAAPGVAFDLDDAPATMQEEFDGGTIAPAEPEGAAAPRPLPVAAEDAVTGASGAEPQADGDAAAPATHVPRVRLPRFGVAPGAPSGAPAAPRSEAAGPPPPSPAAGAGTPPAAPGAPAVSAATGATAPPAPGAAPGP